MGLKDVSIGSVGANEATQHQHPVVEAAYKLASLSADERVGTAIAAHPPRVQQALHLSRAAVEIAHSFTEEECKAFTEGLRELSRFSLANHNFRLRFDDEDIDF